jgi:hypothetical protein
MQEIEINLDTLLEKVDALEKESAPYYAGIDSERPVIQHGNPDRIAQDTVAESLEEEVYEVTEELQEGTEADPPEVTTQLDAAAKLKADGQGRIAAGAKKEADAAILKTRLANAKEKQEVPLGEELTLDMETSTKGGLADMNHIEIKRERNVSKAIRAQNEELTAQNEELTLEVEEKNEEISTLEQTVQEAYSELQEVKNKLKQAIGLNKKLTEGVKQLGSQFTEVSLLNARLLYTNKVLTNSSLNERQKQQIAESVGKARSVEEAKTIYETLKRTAGVVSERKNPPQSLTEAVSRAQSPFLPRVNNNSVDPAAERMRILAGIKK